MPSKYEMKDGEGSLFKNDRKAKETDPNVNGTARIGGVDYVVSGWKKQAKSGVEYLKLSFRPKGETPVKSGRPFNDSVDL